MIETAQSYDKIHNMTIGFIFAGRQRSDISR